MCKNSVYTLTLLIAFLLLPSIAIAKGEDIIKLKGDVEIPKEMVVNNVICVGGSITVYGRVENNVVAVGGPVILKYKSYVGEQVVAVGGEVKKEAGAEVAGRITQVYMPDFIPSFANFFKGGWMVLWATVSVLVLLGFLGLAILLVALIPEHIGTAVNLLERSFMAAFLWGALWMILVVPVGALLAISIIGIVLIPLEILLVALAMMIGYITSSIFIGKNIILSFRKVPLPFVDAILGIVVLFLIGFVPVVGPVIKAVFLIAGFGAVLSTRFGTVK